MQIDHFDQDVLRQTGDASKIMYKLYGSKIRRNNAEKQLAGIRKHIRYKLTIGENHTPHPDEMEEIYIKGDGSRTTKRMMYMSEEDSKKPERVMYLMGYDPGEWELISCKTKRNYWDVTMKLNQGVDSEGNKLPDVPSKHTNHAFTCELAVKPRKEGLKSVIIEEIFKNLQSPKLIEYRHKHNDSGLMLEIPIMDFHLGKLAWGDETDSDNWNVKKAKALYEKSLMELLKRIDQYNVPIEKIIFPIGQDFYHFDTNDNKTTNGTLVDTDSRWIKVYTSGVELLIWAIENLRSIAPVEIMWTGGNHDKMLSYFATHSISCWFNDDDNVHVDLSPTPRKYTRWGKCLIGFAHGQDERNRIEKLMQIEAAKDWGNTIYREFHLGHIHHEKVVEDGGLIIRNMGSITAIDSWHKDFGFVGAVRKMQGIIWDKEAGKQLTIDVNVKV